MSELPEELVPVPEDEPQAESTLLVAIESDEFIAVSEADMQMAETIAATDQLMSEAQDAIRDIIINEFPLEVVLSLLNFEGEIGEDEMAATTEFYSDWVNMNVTPEVLQQEQFFVAGEVVQSTTEEL